jgi:ectoine hydroxylase-related dioxygenase (phytanoyl-CoA dioxygenase family)
MPHRWLSAIWIALEDMTNQNGSLIYVPGSHKLPIFDFYDLKIKVPEYGKQFDSYSEYEEFIRQLVDVQELEVKLLLLILLLFLINLLALHYKIFIFLNN